MDVKGRSASILIDMPALVSVELPGAQSSSSSSSSPASTSAPAKPATLPRDGWTVAKSYVPAAKQLAISGLSWGVRTTASAKIAECASCMGYSEETSRYIAEVVSTIGVAVSQLVVTTGLLTLQDKLGITEAVPVNTKKFKIGQSITLLGTLAAVARGRFGQNFPLEVTMGLSAATGAGALLVATTGAHLLGADMKESKPSSEPFGRRLAKSIVVGGASGAIGAQIGFGTDSAEHAAAAVVSFRTPFIVLREIADRVFPWGKAPDLSDVPPPIPDEQDMPPLIVLVSDSPEASGDDAMPPLIAGSSESISDPRSPGDDDSLRAQGLSRSGTPDSPENSLSSLSGLDFVTPESGERED